MKTVIRDVEEGVSTWWDEIASLQTIVAELKTELASLKEKNDDLEGRMRRCNVHTAEIPEETSLSSNVAVSKLLKEVLSPKKDIVIDRSHRSLTPKKPNGNLRVIIAKLHYYQDSVEVLRRAQEQGPLRYKREPIAIFPDYTASEVRALAAFNDVQNLLRGKRDVQYGIMFPARFKISYKGDSKYFLDPKKAMAYMKSMIQNEETVQSDCDTIQVIQFIPGSLEEDCSLSAVSVTSGAE
ncbi:putative transposase element L1Md-A101/L1Md-A102/L1Md-A2 [Labeo rohita]|uniref:Putative transposase element L1Md-A101/L1Md-A102/L1Md-A2 n=1 Tax=Labeo rohita TaxID=84645 RepID=A0A498M752_LABRO|nr:putative transposase element L1Md-A101/L1Md-A102/L1Md-A2 [Labeo rohita]RXN13475.1 putative transposase element L1Md-A101/L1Md-A102/L1Md-A2 [Labeo rohita]